MTVRELEFLFHDNSSAVLRRAHQLLGDREAARDIVQEVFLRALNAQPEISTGGTLGAWLHRITTNLCLDRLRDASRRNRILSRSAPDRVVPCEHGCDTQLTARALLHLVPEEMQAIVVYHFVDQMSQDEISSLTGIPRRTIGYRLEQFRVRARAVMTSGPQAS